MEPSDRNRWVAIEHDFCDNPKILQVGAVGGWVHLRAIIYAARHRTNGFVPDPAIHQILHSDPVVDNEANDGLLASMIQANLWHRVANGYQIHDYLKHQTNAETIREKRARAGRLGGLAKAGKYQQNKLEEEEEEEDTSSSSSKEEEVSGVPEVPRDPNAIHMIRELADRIGSSP